MSKKVTILYGGPSNEHDVSIASAKNILKNINQNKYSVFEIYINKKGIFYFKENNKIISRFLEKDLITFLKKENIEKVFPLLHGKYGEDGKLQKILERKKINFVGSSSRASSLCMDKDKTNKILSKNDIFIPKSKIIYKDKFKHNLKYPIIVKPVDEGSSFGLFKIESEVEFLKNLSKFFRKNNILLAQEYISGREFTCGILDIKNKTKALSVSEIILTKTKTFNYKAKYTKDAVNEITPASIDKKLTKKIQDLARKCHIILGCRDISRTDILLNIKDNNLYVLETNTMPGMTQTSFVPEQAKSSGINISKLIDILLD